MPAVRALLLRAVALLSCMAAAAGAAVQASPSGPLVLLCNTTGPCRPCKSLHRRASASCSLNVYEQTVRCDVADADEDLGEHDVRVEPLQGKKYTLGDEVNEYAPCEMPQKGSLLKFEAFLMAALAAAVAVIRRRRAAWS
jgi:hypothetical protein